MKIKTIKENELIKINDRIYKIISVKWKNGTELTLNQKFNKMRKCLV